jgi:hypothetical protein
LLGQVLLTHPQTPLDVIFKLEDKVTLAQTVEFRDWFQRLPAHLKTWIRGET